ncbi:TonB-dependent receptor [candidate division WOR-3 bacterium]|uniref:TonB-dependent receptor n=1 Tax=candidate division WOR-3 bacterium TaxID=2052148 RepID=A0A9D5QDD2_UNCW3|nr:TonB-dependent receptor [candidate division WOR-3 bacterium]MBD3364992.1 TonB-dependent receptor [candidate division WOR-3 bacterium]
MRRLITFLVFSLSLIPVVVSAGVTGMLRGTVTDAATGGGCEGVLVILLRHGQETDYSTHTNQNGEYAISDIPPGGYAVQFSTDGYRTFAVSALIEVDRIIQMDAVLSKDTPIEADDSTGQNPAHELGLPTERINAKDPVADEACRPSESIVHVVYTMWHGIKTAPRFYVHPDFKDAPLNFTPRKDGLSGACDAGYQTQENLYRGFGNLEYRRRSSSLTTDLWFGGRANIRDAEKVIPNSGFNRGLIDFHPHFYKPGFPYWGYMFYTFSASDSAIIAPPEVSLSRLEKNNRHNLSVSNHLRPRRPMRPDNLDIELRFDWNRVNRDFHLIYPDSTGSGEYELNNQTLFDIYTVSLIPEIDIDGYGRFLRGGAFRVDLNCELITASSNRASFINDTATTREMDSYLPYPDSRQTTFEGVIQFAFPEHPIQVEETGIDENTGEIRYRYARPPKPVAFLAGAGYKSVKTDLPDTARSPFELEDHVNGSWDGQLGVIIQPWTLSIPVFAERQFRAPSITERCGIGPYLNTSFLGNPELEPEKSLKLSAGINQVIIPDQERWFHLYWSMSGFVNIINDYIYSERTGVHDYGLPQVTWRNVSDARVMGGEATLSFYPLFYPIRGLGIISNVYYQQADDVSTGTPLGCIPPLKGDVTLRYYNFFLDVNVWMEWAAEQDRLGAYETETPAHHVFNASLELNFYKWTRFPLEMSLSVNNICNTYYQDHLSWTKDYYGQPGRSFGASMSAGF